MNLELLIPFIVMIIAGVVALALCFYLWQRRARPGSGTFLLLMAAIAIYSFTDAGGLAATQLAAKILWSKLSYLGVVNVAPLWFLFAASYSQHTKWLAPRWMIALWIIPAATFLLVLTNELHKWIWTSITPVSAQTGAPLIFSHGPAFWIHAIYAYLLLLVGTIWLVQAALHSPALFRRQVYSLLAAALVPWIANLLYIFNLNPWPGLELTPIAFAITGVVVVWNIFHFQMMDLAPVAREVLFESLADGVLVLDIQNRIVDINPTAREWMGVDDMVIGLDFREVIPPDQMLETFNSEDEIQSRLEIVNKGQRLVYNLKISPLKDKHNNTLGRVARLHNISHEHHLLETEQQRVRQLAALQSISQIVVSSLELDQIFETVVQVLQDTFGYPLISIYKLEGETLILGAQVGFPPGYSLPQIPITQGIMGRSLRTRRAQFVGDVKADPDYIGPIENIESEISTPLLLDQRLLGTLNVESTRERPLTEADVNLLSSFANQVAIAIDHANLFQAERQARELAEALRQVGLALTESLDFETVLDRLLGEIKRVIPYDSGCVMLLDDSGKAARIIRQTGYERFGEDVEQHTARLEFEIANTPNLRRMVASKEPLIIEDTTQEPGWLNFKLQAHIRSWIGAPVIIKGRVTAFLSLDRHEPNFYHSEHAQRLVAFASQVAIAFENARLYAEVRELSIVDELTGLYNRRGFYEIGRREMERSSRFEHPISALFIDIDDFKQFNDRYSYAVGDRVLRLLAECLQTHLRATDVIGRYGGEEFVVLLPDTTREQAGGLAERVRMRVAALRLDTGQDKQKITISIGVCQRTPDHENLDALLHNAGQAVHQAKSGGKNQVAFS